MVVTIPHMGNVYLAVKALLDDLGISYILPQPNTRASLQLGSLYSPEEICLPFKLVMGNFIQSIEKGADTVLITGSCGPCRFGEYCELNMKLLRQMGYDLEFIVLDLSPEIGLKEFRRRIAKISENSGLSSARKAAAVLKAIKIMSMIDSLEARAHYLAGFETDRGDCKNILHRALRDARESRSSGEMAEILKTARQELENVPIEPHRDPIRVAIIGEIYTVIEPFSNLYIEDMLMDRGVCVKRQMTLSWWLRDLIMKPLKLNSIDLRINSRHYLPYYIGGHGRECIGEAVKAWREGMDGAIQIFPMGCMPEIVAKAVLPAIQNDKDFPILTLIVDEMTGEAGYITRVEAFLSMLEKRKRSGGKRITGVKKGHGREETDFAAEV